MKPHHLVNFC